MKMTEATMADEATWQKLPALAPAQAGLRSSCLTSGPHPIELAMDSPILVGFGEAGVTRDGVAIWTESPDPYADFWSAADAEARAAQDPDHDWRIFYLGPLSNATYQRHGAGRWVLVERGRGFARDDYDPSESSK